MSTISIDPLLRHCSRICSARSYSQFVPSSRAIGSSSPLLVRCSSKRLSHGGRSFCRFRPARVHLVRASGAGSATKETVQSEEVLFKETFPVTRTVKEEGKIFVRLDNGKDGQKWQLTVGCSLPGKWILHWGVSFVDDVGSEWDQPPDKMRPPGSIPIKDYAIETPLMKPSSPSSKGDAIQEVKIDCEPSSGISAINFVLKDVETGAWYQHRGRDFKVPLVDYLQDDGNMVGGKRGFSLWPGPLGQLSNLLLKPEAQQSNTEDSASESADPGLRKRLQDGFYVEQPIAREVFINCSVCVSLRKCPETAKNLVYLETDIPGDVVVHWGVCRDESKTWAIPAAPYPQETVRFKNKALRTLLQPKEGGSGSAAIFTVDEEFVGFLFVLKLNENTWLNCKGTDFYIPLSSASSVLDQKTHDRLEEVHIVGETAEEKKEDSPGAYSKGIIDEIRSLVSDISSEKSRNTKTKEAQETILQEIEKLAAEAYSIFRTSVPTSSEDEILESEAVEPPVKICSGTGSGSGFEILCQGFNWESHKSGRWYIELKEKVEELASLGITVIWLPPPTESVSPEGYMPKDLYNLNSRYGSMDQLKDLVKKLHEVGITVLGDVVLNHRCAHYQNQNGIWNIFGGRLNWDDRAVVADDPHFQGRGNKSSGDCFLAAPNIDHSQDFVRNDIKEWLLWLRLIFRIFSSLSHHFHYRILYEHIMQSYIIHLYRFPSDNIRFPVYGQKESNKKRGSYSS